MSVVLEVDEVGSLTLPPEVLGDPPPHTRFVADSEGEAIILRRTDVPTVAGEFTPEGTTGYMARWDALASRVGRAWKAEATATEVVAEMRR